MPTWSKTRVDPDRRRAGSPACRTRCTGTPTSRARALDERAVVAAGRQDARLVAVARRPTRTRRSRRSTSPATSTSGFPDCCASCTRSSSTTSGTCPSTRTATATCSSSCSSRPASAAALFRLSTSARVRWLFHGQFTGQDGWMVDVMDCPPERLYRPDVSITRWRTLCDHAPARQARQFVDDVRDAMTDPSNRRLDVSASTPTPAPDASTTCTPAAVRPCCCCTRRRARGTSSATSCPLLAATHHVYTMDTLGFGDSEKPDAPDEHRGVRRRRDRVRRRGRARHVLASSVTTRAASSPSRSPGGTPNGSRSSCSRARRVPTARAATATGRRSTPSRSPTDGSHLVELYNKRAYYYPPDRPDLLHRLVLDCLKCGLDRVEEGHDAVNSFKIEEPLAGVSAPTLLSAAPRTGPRIRSKTSWRPISPVASGSRSPAAAFPWSITCRRSSPTRCWPSSTRDD